MITFNPGPSQLSPMVPGFLNEIISSGFLSVSHRSSKFNEVCKNAVESLRQKMNIPSDYSIFFQPSATVAMDTVLRNVVENYSFHFVHGAFSRRFFQTAVDINLKVSKHETALDVPINWQQASIPENTELICITHNETSTGLMWPRNRIQEIRQAYTQSLIAVDVTSSFGGMQFDWNMADLWFGSVQKCLGMPSGLGFLIVNSRGMDKSAFLINQKKCIPEWHRFNIMAKFMKDYQTYETPNMLAIALLARLMESWDLQKIEEETFRKAALLYGANIAWTPFVNDPVWRSLTVCHFNVDDPIRWKKLAQDANIVLGSGYGELKNAGIRIANFPSHTYEMVEYLLKVLTQVI